MLSLRPLVLLLIAVGLSACATRATPSAPAPVDTVAACPDGREWNGDLVHVCEERTVTLSGRDLVLDASPNGSVLVVGEDRRDVRVVATVRAAAPTEAQARRLLAEARIETTGAVRTVDPGDHSGPTRSWVGADYEVRVPRRSDVTVDALNGSIDLRDLDGRIRAETINGSLTLSRIAGDVEARTVNGGVRASLDGDAWRGKGLRLTSTNGPIHVDVPGTYSASVDARSAIGPIRIEGLPLDDDGCTREGRRAVPCMNRRVQGYLGRGGSPVSVATTNGPIQIRQR